MNLLLDTHIWLWALLEPERLPPGAARAIADPGNRCSLSSLTIWEAMLLAERRRIEIDDDGEAWIRGALVGAEVAFASRQMDTPHADPPCDSCRWAPSHAAERRDADGPPVEVGVAHPRTSGATLYHSAWASAR